MWLELEDECPWSFLFFAEKYNLFDLTDGENLVTSISNIEYYEYIILEWSM